MKNLHYETDEISSYFSENRIKWAQFYPSERKLFESIDLVSKDKILDIGCGCGGLGLALNEKFGISSYTGVDINLRAIEVGRQLNPTANLICGDILDLTNESLSDHSFDIVCSLSCIDWNIQFYEMLLASWRHVKPGGKFVATFRLCLEKGTDKIKESYQYINYQGKKEGEIAAYVVLSFQEFMAELKRLNPAEIKGTGYWRAPSPSAVTPYSSLCFAAFSIKKRDHTDDEKVNLDLDLDLTEELLATIKKPFL